LTPTRIVAAAPGDAERLLDQPCRQRQIADMRAVILAHTREVVGTATPLCHPVRVTPRFKRVLELARAEARRLEHRCAGTEHVLLGIARLDEGVAAHVLRDLGGQPDRV